MIRTVSTAAIEARLRNQPRCLGRAQPAILAAGPDARRGTLGDECDTNVAIRVGAAGDNASMESSFALLQKNVLDRRRWETREELRLAIVTWIERTYQRPRRSRRRRVGAVH
jgi:transposase InsO family protein